MEIKEKLKLLPLSPGVYLMKDSLGAVIYVGKAGSLRKRVSSYFSRSRFLSAKTSALYEDISDIDYILCTSEEDALLLEASLIKKYNPKYNVELKDGKSYPYLKISRGDFPKLYIGRGMDDGSISFGPYTDAKLLRKALKILRRIFKLRSCNFLPKEECLDYHIGLCVAPCAGKAPKNYYNEIVRELVMFLEGRRGELLRGLKDKMARYSKEKKFEEAACARDKIEALSTLIAGHGKFSGINALEELKSALKLAKVPRRIEIFDISNIMADAAAGSMVSFFNGKPDKSGYRRFRIATRGINDYDMMREVVRRRYTRVKMESLKYPDLVIIDGGRGHLNAVLSELDKIGIDKLNVVAIAKRNEVIFRKGSAPISMERHSEALKLVQVMRNEAHRFAVGYHRKLRGWKMLNRETAKFTK